MAKIHEEDIKLNIIVGHNAAQKKIYELEKANRGLRQEQSKLLELKTKLESQNKKESTEYKNTVKRLRELRGEISANSARMRQLVEDVGLMAMTAQQLNQRAKTLRLTLSKMVPGSEKYKELQKELAMTTNRINQLRMAGQQQSLTWSSAANWLNKYQTMLVGLAASVTGVTLTFQKWLDYSGKLADQQANVRKTTGMTDQAVKELTKSVAQFDTRTSRMDLLKIAEEGGRIGIAAEEMVGFVRVMDQASVALGDTFTGGVEEVASVLGKLKFLFEETKDMGVEDAYLSIGSALNELGANGVATEQNIAEFATRLGSLPKQLKPTVAEALALGAAFEESGIKAEIGSRAYSIFMNRAAQKTAEFAKVMGMTTQEAQNLLNTNPTEFFLKFGESLGKSNVSATQMAQLLQKMGINADGANKIVGAISNNTKRFRDQIDLSNKSLVEATSLTNEFGVKNNNLAGVMDKIQKKLAAIFTSEDIMNWLADAVDWFAKLIGATDDADGSGKRWRDGLTLSFKLLMILVVGIVSYNSAMKLNAIWTARATAGSMLWNLQMKIQNSLAAISVIRIGMMTAAKALFRKGVRAAIVELRIMNSLLAVSPWGVVAAGIGLVASAYYLFRNETDKAIRSQKLIKEAFADAEKSTASQRKEIEMLLKIGRDQNAEQEKRIKALNRLNEIMPGYNDLLTIEKINTLEAANAINKYTTELQRNAKVKALQSKYDQLESDKIDIQNKTTKDYRSGADKVSDSIFGFFGVETKEYSTVKELEEFYKTQGFDKAAIDKLIKQSGLLKKDAEIHAITEAQKVIEKEWEKLMNSGTFGGDDESLGDPLNIDTSDPKKDDKAKQDRERRIAELIKENEALANELLTIRRNYEDADLAMQEASYEKELAQIDLEAKRRKEDLQRQIVDQKVFDDLAKERTKALNSNDNERVRLIDDLSSKLLEKNAELENSILQLTISAEYKKNRVHADYANKRFASIQKEFQKQKEAREQEFLEELIELGSVEAVKERLREVLSKKELDAIRTWSDAKEALRETYREEELDAEIDHIVNLLNEMENAWDAQGFFGGMDLTLMTNEEKEKFLSDVDELKQKLLELGVAKADLQNGNTGDEMSQSYGGFGNADILGMSPDDWVRFIENIQSGKFELEELAATVGMLQNVFSQYFAMVQAGEQRNIQQYERNVNRRREALKRQLDNGMLSQEEYDRKSAKLEKEAERRREEMEYKAAMQQYRQNIMNAVAGTAMMIINAAQTQPFFPMGLIMTGVAGVMGALQLATIKKQKPVKGYEKGLYNEDMFDVIREQDGKKFRAGFGGETRSGMVNTPTVFMAGERGPEMIIDNLAFRQLSPDLKSDLFSELARIKGYERGLYPEMSSSNSVDSSKLVEDLLAQNNVLMERNNALLQQLTETYGQSYIVADYEAMRKLQKAQEDYKNHESKNKV